MEYKGEIIKFEDTNIALLGTELETKIRLAAAEEEEAWKGVGITPGLEIWRIEKFKVMPWPNNEYGYFYSGDTYIVLSTYQKPNNEGFSWKAHMWVGKHTTMDEAGTAAYKIVELDTLFNREMVLYRESQGMETETFLNYFTKITIMEGGIESGFKKVPVESYKPRLFRIRKTSRGHGIIQVQLNSSSLNSEDVFILDAGLILFKWLGSKANGFEKFDAAILCESIKEERLGKPKIIELEENSRNEEFWGILGGERENTDSPSANNYDSSQKENSMFRLSEKIGVLELEQIKLDKAALSNQDVFFVDAGNILYIWMGSQSSKNEKVNSIIYAKKYIEYFQRPSTLPMCIIPEGKETKKFLDSFAN
jgi:gelsolin